MRCKQQADERAVVLEFLTARGITVLDDQILNRDPPEPDILVTGLETGNVAYEVVRLVVQDEEHRLTKIAELESHFHRAALQVLHPQFKNATISVTLRLHHSDRLLERALIDLCEWINSLTDNCAGQIDITSVPINRFIKELSVERSSSQLTTSIAPYCLAATDPTVPLIQAKLEKYYQSDYPIELLAYIPFVEAFPIECWYQELKSFLSGDVVEPSFQRIWVFHRQLERVQFEYSFES